MDRSRTNPSMVPKRSTKTITNSDNETFRKEFPPLKDILHIGDIEGLG